MERKLKNEWEVSALNRETNEWTTTVNHSWEHTPETPDIADLLVRQAPASIIRPTRRRRPKSVEQETLVFGDAQIPFHSETAFRLAQTAISQVMPNNIVFVGDMIDLPSMSKYEQRSEWVGQTQSAIDTYHSFLAEARANAPNANIYVVHGNHEQRLVSYVQRNAQEVLGLRRANLPHELAVLSLQHLVRYDDLEVKSIDGYPNGTLWLEDNLKFIHGTYTKTGGSNAARYLATEHESTIFGHTHRQEMAYRTKQRRNGAAVIAAASPGALCMTDGTVPGVNHTVDSQGEVVKKADNWQQGLLRINHEGLHHEITPVRFTERGMILDGKRFQ